MSEENQPLDPYEVVLSDLRKKREQIDQAISALESLRGSGAAPVAGDSQAQFGGITETAGMFLGMSIVDATKKLLALRKRTMANAEILAELKAGGLVLTSNDPMNVVGSVLTRRFNNIGDVVRVGRGTWGLKEWYPGRNFKTKASASAEPSAAREEAAEPPPSGEFSALANTELSDMIG